jgi:hypothetical protein
VTGAPAERTTKSFSQIVAELEAIDPWNHKEADEERRREGLPPVHFRRLRRLLKTKKAKKRIVLCAQSLVVVAVFAAGIAYIKLSECLSWARSGFGAGTK